MQERNKAVTDRRLRPRYCHLASYLRRSRPRLQEVVQNVRCLQRIFLRAKHKAEYVWASLPQPGGEFEQPQLMCKCSVIHKTGSTYHSTTSPEEDRATATGNMHIKFGRVVPKVWSRTDKHTDTHSQTDTFITILRSPYRGRVIITASTTY